MDVFVKFTAFTGNVIKKLIGDVKKGGWGGDRFQIFVTIFLVARFSVCLSNLQSGKKSFASARPHLIPLTRPRFGAVFLGSEKGLFWTHKKAAENRGLVRGLGGLNRLYGTK